VNRIIFIKIPRGDTGGTVTLLPFAVCVELSMLKEQHCLDGRECLGGTFFLNVVFQGDLKTVNF
jgi:hypothetical protein